MATIELADDEARERYLRPRRAGPDHPRRKPLPPPRLEGLLREGTGIRIAVEVVESGTVPGSEGKAVRVVDRRSAA
jgi:hypothetical protein